MPRIRTIKPEIWSSPQVMNLKPLARLLFLGLITQADDDGIGVGDPRKLKAQVFPGDDEVGAGLVLELCTEVAAQNLVRFYDDEKHGRLFHLPSFRSHQVISHPTPTRYPKPPWITAPQPTAPVALQEDSVKTPYGSDRKGSDWKGSDLKGSDPDARARERPRRARAAPEAQEARDPRAEVLKLAKAGMRTAGEIVRLLPALKLDPSKVEAWIAEENAA